MQSDEPRIPPATQGAQRLAVDEAASGARAVTQGRPAPATQFVRGMWRLAAANVTAGNAVRLLHEGPETFDDMIAGIESARESVALESYIVRNDAVGSRFADALVAAAGRGLRVQLLSDWIGSRSTPRRFWDRLREAGVEVRLFNPPGWRRWLGLVPRDHRKLLVLDERVGITGGFGLGEEWDARTRYGRPRNWRDTGVRIEGPAAVDMRRAFDTMWRRSELKWASGHVPRDQVQRSTFRIPQSTERSLVAVVEGDPWRLRVARGLQVQSVLAERSIWIATAYFIPSFVEIEGLVGAARDGVDVRLLLPSRNDHPWVTWLARKFYPGLLRNGVRIWEWGGPMMHAKTAVVDGRWVRVGSTDLNPLGFAINYELDVVIDDDEVGRDAEEMFLADLERSCEVDRRLVERRRSNP